MVSLPDDPQTLARKVIEGFRRHELLSSANAIAFQIVFGAIPLALFLLGLAGFLGLEDVYADEVQGELAQSTSPNVFVVLDDTFRRVLSSGETFWVTAGAVFAVWKLSGAMRAVMGAFARIYEGEDRRRGLAVYRVSIALSVVGGALLLGAVAAVRLLPGLLAWPLAVALMSATVALIVHYAPARRHPWQFVSLGTAIVVLAWSGTSVAFGFYVTEIADFGSIYGNLATVVIVFEYVYLAAIAFLTGALLDSIVRPT